jgi:hypothetical protein
MIHEVNISVRLALFHVLAVILGVILTRVAFLGCGYPDSNLDWDALALIVRNHGYVLLLVPVAWTSTVVYLENHAPGRWSKRLTVCSGLLLLAALVLLFFWCCSNPYHGRMRYAVEQ